MNNDRDSASAQNNVSEIYSRLKSGLDFSLKTDPTGFTLWIEFVMPSLENIDEISKNHLCVDSVSNYREKVDPDYENEMFEPFSYAPDQQYSGYLPSRKKLDSSSGSDWY